ncbi:MAG: hypothetical protein ACQESZ_06965 [Bacteroidota bacterium]
MTDKRFWVTCLIMCSLLFYSCYDDNFDGPAGYSNYYFDNQTGLELFLEYKLGEGADGEIRLTSIIFPDSMVNFHNDKQTGSNPMPSQSFEWIRIFERVNDTTDHLLYELDPMVDSVWANEHLDDFSPGEWNWYFSYP